MILCMCVWCGLDGDVVLYNISRYKYCTNFENDSLQGKCFNFQCFNGGVISKSRWLNLNCWWWIDGKSNSKRFVWQNIHVLDNDALHRSEKLEGYVHLVLMMWNGIVFSELFNNLNGNVRFDVQIGIPICRNICKFYLGEIYLATSELLSSSKMSLYNRTTINIWYGFNLKL